MIFQSMTRHRWTFLLIALWTITIFAANPASFSAPKPSINHRTSSGHHSKVPELSLEPTAVDKVCATVLDLGNSEYKDLSAFASRAEEIMHKPVSSRATNLLIETFLKTEPAKRGVGVEPFVRCILYHFDMRQGGKHFGSASNEILGSEQRKHLKDYLLHVARFIAELEKKRVEPIRSEDIVKLKLLLSSLQSISNLNDERSLRRIIGDSIDVHANNSRVSHGLVGPFGDKTFHPFNPKSDNFIKAVEEFHSRFLEAAKKGMSKKEDLLNYLSDDDKVLFGLLQDTNLYEYQILESLVGIQRAHAAREIFKRLPEGGPGLGVVLQQGTVDGSSRKLIEEINGIEDPAIRDFLLAVYKDPSSIDVLIEQRAPVDRLKVIQPVSKRERIRLSLIGVYVGLDKNEFLTGQTESQKAVQAALERLLVKLDNFTPKPGKPVSKSYAEEFKEVKETLDQNYQSPLTSKEREDILKFISSSSGHMQLGLGPEARRDLGQLETIDIMRIKALMEHAGNLGRKENEALVKVLRNPSAEAIREIKNQWDQAELDHQSLKPSQQIGDSLFTSPTTARFYRTAIYKPENGILLIFKGPAELAEYEKARKFDSSLPGNLMVKVSKEHGKFRYSHHGLQSLGYQQFDQMIAEIIPKLWVQVEGNSGNKQFAKWDEVRDIYEKRVGVPHFLSILEKKYLKPYGHAKDLPFPLEEIAKKHLGNPKDVADLAAMKAFLISKLPVELGQVVRPIEQANFKAAMMEAIRSIDERGIPAKLLSVIRKPEESGPSHAIKHYQELMVKRSEYMVKETDAEKQALADEQFFESQLGKSNMGFPTESRLQILGLSQVERDMLRHLAGQLDKNPKDRADYQGLILTGKPEEIQRVSYLVDRDFYFDLVQRAELFPSADISLKGPTVTSLLDEERFDKERLKVLHQRLVSQISDGRYSPEELAAYLALNEKRLLSLMDKEKTAQSVLLNFFDDDTELASRLRTHYIRNLSIEQLEKILRDTGINSVSKGALEATDCQSEICTTILQSADARRGGDPTSQGMCATGVCQRIGTDLKQSLGLGGPSTESGGEEKLEVSFDSWTKKYLTSLGQEKGVDSNVYSEIDGLQIPQLEIFLKALDVPYNLAAFGENASATAVQEYARIASKMMQDMEKGKKPEPLPKNTTDLDKTLKIRDHMRLQLKERLREIYREYLVSTVSGAALNPLVFEGEGLTKASLMMSAVEKLVDSGLTETTQNRALRILRELGFEPLTREEQNTTIEVLISARAHLLAGQDEQAQKVLKDVFKATDDLLADLKDEQTFKKKLDRYTKHTDLEVLNEIPARVVHRKGIEYLTREELNTTIDVLIKARVHLLAGEDEKAQIVLEDAFNVTDEFLAGLKDKQTFYGILNEYTKQTGVEVLNEIQARVVHRKGIEHYRPELVEFLEKKRIEELPSVEDLASAKLKVSNDKFRKEYESISKKMQMEVQSLNSYEMNHSDVLGQDGVSPKYSSTEFEKAKFLDSENKNSWWLTDFFYGRIPNMPDPKKLPTWYDVVKAEQDLREKSRLTREKIRELNVQLQGLKSKQATEREEILKDARKARAAIHKKWASEFIAANRGIEEEFGAEGYSFTASEIEKYLDINERFHRTMQSLPTFGSTINPSDPLVRDPLVRYAREFEEGRWLSKNQVEEKLNQSLSSAIRKRAERKIIADQLLKELAPYGVRLSGDKIVLDDAELWQFLTRDQLTQKELGLSAAQVDRNRSNLEKLAKLVGTPNFLDDIEHEYTVQWIAAGSPSAFEANSKTAAKAVWNREADRTVLVMVPLDPLKKKLKEALEVASDEVRNVLPKAIEDQTSFWSSFVFTMENLKQANTWDAFGNLPWEILPPEWGGKPSETGMQSQLKPNADGTVPDVVSRDNPKSNIDSKNSFNRLTAAIFFLEKHGGLIDLKLKEDSRSLAATDWAAVFKERLKGHSDRLTTKTQDLEDSATLAKRDLVITAATAPIAVWTKGAITAASTVRNLTAAEKMYMTAYGLTTQTLKTASTLTALDLGANRVVEYFVPQHTKRGRLEAKYGKDADKAFYNGELIFLPYEIDMNRDGVLDSQQGISTTPSYADTSRNFKDTFWQFLKIDAMTLGLNRYLGWGQRASSMTAMSTIMGGDAYAAGASLPDSFVSGLKGAVFGSGVAHRFKTPVLREAWAYGIFGGLSAGQGVVDNYKLPESERESYGVAAFHHMIDHLGMDLAFATGVMQLPSRLFRGVKEEVTLANRAEQGRARTIMKNVPVEGIGPLANRLGEKTEILIPVPRGAKPVVKGTQVGRWGDLEPIIKFERDENAENDNAEPGTLRKAIKWASGKINQYVTSRIPAFMKRDLFSPSAEKQIIAYAKNKDIVQLDSKIPNDALVISEMAKQFGIPERALTEEIELIQNANNDGTQHLFRPKTQNLYAFAKALAPRLNEATRELLHSGSVPKDKGVSDVAVYQGITTKDLDLSNPKHEDVLRKISTLYGLTNDVVPDVLKRAVKLTQDAGKEKGMSIPVTMIAARLHNHGDAISELVRGGMPGLESLDADKRPKAEAIENIFASPWYVPTYTHIQIKDLNVSRSTQKKPKDPTKIDMSDGVQGMAIIYAAFHHGVEPQELLKRIRTDHARLDKYGSRTIQYYIDQLLAEQAVEQGAVMNE